MNFADLLSRTDAVARSQGMRVVLVRAGANVYQLVAPGDPGAVGVDAASERLFDDLDAALAGADGTGLLPIVGQLVRAGIERRRTGELTDAHFHMRVALWAALRLQDPRGLAAVSSNLFVIREAVRDVLERSLGPSRVGIRTDEQRQALADYEAELRRLQPGLRADAAQAWRRLEALRPVLEPALADRALSDLLLGALRLAQMAGSDEVAASVRDTLSKRLRSIAARTADWEPVIESAAEALADLELDQVVTGDSEPPAVAWYAEVRRHLDTVAQPRGIAAAAANAYRHLNSQRVRLTAGGGTFGHLLSYRASRVLQYVGRDLVMALHRMGQHDEAFATLETVRARALTDWMGRTHPNRGRVPPHFLTAINPVFGSMNAVWPASLEEMRAAAADEAVAVVAYLQLASGAFLASVLRPDGRITGVEIADPTPQVHRVVATLPYDGAPDPTTIFSAATTRAIDDALAALCAAIWPAAVREALEGIDRVAILPDGILEAVPFGALRDGQGYLAERYEFVHWPSITGWLVMRDAAEVVAANERWQPGVALARTSFDTDEPPGGRRLPPLPYAAAEAMAVAEEHGLTCLLEDQATWRALREVGAALGVVHIATHGVLDLEHGEHSFLALADGPLSAGALYRYDPGIRAGLVVLSACQTGLGGAHPDSVVGLANAFLVAGGNAVVATLWQIPDVTTAKLMQALYGHLADGDTVPAALRAAQLTCLESANPVLRSPVTWGAFKASGLSTPVPSVHPH
jgi:CHAT domain-containing protein